MGQRNLSKSKLIAFRQCPKRLWLEVHQPELREDSKSTQAIFRTGHEVGELAQRLYDPTGQGELIDLHAEGVGPAIERSKSLLLGNTPVFEAGFAAGGAMAFADVMLPVSQDGKAAWRMVEVKSSTSVKDYYLDDIAIQSFVARESGVRLTAVSLAHIDSSWTYKGDGDYRGLLVEKDLTQIAFSRTDEVRTWIAAAQAVVSKEAPPDVVTGLQCTDPFPCSFSAHCHKDKPNAVFPVAWLPRIQSKTLKTFINENAVVDMCDIPQSLLNLQQRRVRDQTVSGECYFDAVGAKCDLQPYTLPAYFLDFETIQFGVPKWAGTRPFQSLPFQFSSHRLDEQGTLVHHGFLDLSGKDPTHAFACALVETCGDFGPIFVYNLGFEGSRINELAQRFPELKTSLLAIKQRLVDLLPIAQARFYHPSQRGSWSIKKLLPAIAPKLNYQQLDGVQDGDMAMQAFLEAIEAGTTEHRKQEIHDQLQAYCALDTLAMVEIWKKFSGVSLPDPNSFASSLVQKSGSGMCNESTLGNQGWDYLGGRLWSQITRDERFFCQHLFNLVKGNKKINEFVGHINELAKLEGDEMLPTESDWEIGFEVCFYRDIWHHRKQDHILYSPKRTFDLCLFSKKHIVIIEAKAQQGFGSDATQLEAFKNDREEIEKLELGVQVLIIALASSKYVYQDGTRRKLPDGIFDGQAITWKDLYECYPDHPELCRADAIYQAASGGNNNDGYISGEEAFNNAAQGKKFCVGRGGGLEGYLFREDLGTGSWWDHSYEYSSNAKPKNKNWISSVDFYNAAKKFGKPYSQ